MKRVLTCVALIASMFCCANIKAEEDQLKKDIDTRYTHYYLSYKLNASGAAVTTYDYAKKILQQEVLEYEKKEDISYSTSAEKADILSAYTLKADGRKIQVAPSSYQLRINKGKDDNIPPAFSDVTSMTIVFPELEVGDSTVLSYSITQSVQYFPKYFSERLIFDRSVAYDDVRITLDAPESLGLQFDSPFLTQESFKQKDGQMSVEWRYTNKAPIRNKRKTTMTFGQWPGLAISNFKSYAEIATNYGERANEKSRVTPRIQTLADEQTHGVTDPKEQAKLLYEWVAKNISYAGNCIGVGAVVPRDIDFVLDNKMGDCKDHATLLQALLAAKGIKSTQALVNASTEYVLPKIPIVSAVNHVINYIPTLDLYLDSTSQTMPFGVLSKVLSGKPTLLVSDFKSDSRIPVTPSDYDQYFTEITMSISEDGSVDGVEHNSYRGYSAISLNSAFENFTEEKEDIFIKNILRARHYEGKLTLSKEGTLSPLPKYQMDFNFSIRDFVQMSSAGTLAIASPVDSSPMGNMVEHFVSGELPDYDFPCSGITVKEVFTCTLPKNMKLLALPENFSVKNQYVDYNSSYTQNGNQIKIERNLIDSTKGPVCSPDVMNAYKEIGKKILPDIKTQLVYKLTALQENSSK